MIIMRWCWCMIAVFVVNFQLFAAHRCFGLAGHCLQHHPLGRTTPLLVVHWRTSRLLCPPHHHRTGRWTHHHHHNCHHFSNCRCSCCFPCGETWFAACTTHQRADMQKLLILSARHSKIKTTKEIEHVIVA